MPINHREIAFEDAIEQHLLDEAGYARREPASFDAEAAIDRETFLAFVQAAQHETWAALSDLHGNDTAGVLAGDLLRALDGSAGMLGVLRHGFKCFGKRVQAAYFAPAHGMNPDTESLYAANRLTVTRQVHYSTDEPKKSVDLVLSLNGLPVATAELKNPLTGQTVVHAKKQYREDRDPKQKLFEFKKRALVHFAVDPDEVAMTTRLSGAKTFFLPFNRGHDHGAGNPPNPDGYRTAYLWEQVWQRDSLLDILARFVHLQVEEKKVAGKKIRKEKMIFPRYHQLDAVRSLEVDAREVGPGKNYLIQHSAGSGKSNSIGWLAHRLSSLHDAKNEKVFDSVIVITDRIVLDRQLQDTIYQFEHKQGVVQKIDEDSQQLADALKTAVPIIVTTLWKFPFVAEKIEGLPDRSYAVLVDEAHSSQSGETATELKSVLSGARIKEEIAEEVREQGLPDHEEQLLRTMAARGKQANLSFFAFTATPKYKTLEVFGVAGADGRPQPFHLYSMRQAIEEGFILDVLQHYTTYKTYYRLVKTIDDDPEVDKRKATRALARFLNFHPHNVAQKAEVMLEHFRAHTRHKIGGKAKAMVVTSSRLQAVRYKQEFDRQINEKSYNDLRTLVAFSGEVKDPDAEGVTYTEPGMNVNAKNGKPIGLKELPERFAEPEYHVLIVADKYQTGFDQPLLHTMYVDKRLAGIQAVQTLSRLNRMHPGKEDTFVLDFVNERDEIFDAFQDYYETTGVGEQVEPHKLNELLDDIMDRQIIYREEVDKLCTTFFGLKSTAGNREHARLYVHTDPAVGRFKILDQEEQDDFRAKINTYRNLYGFLAQIIPFRDSDLEKLYTYVRFLLRRLPSRDPGPQYQFDDDVTLQYYRLQKISEGAIELDKQAPGELDGPLEVGTGQNESPQVELSELIDVLNDKYGTRFAAADQLFFDQIREDIVASEELQQVARANQEDNFKRYIAKVIEGLVIDRMDRNEETVTTYLNNQDMKDVVNERLAHDAYEQILTQSTSE